MGCCAPASRIRLLNSEHNLTMLMVTHQMGFAREVSDRVCFFYDGKIEEQVTPDRLFGAPEGVRTRQFLSAMLAQTGLDEARRDREPRRRNRVAVAHRTAAEAPRHGGAAQGTGGRREAARVPVERSGLDRRVHGGTPREMCNLALAHVNSDPAWGPPAGAPTCSTAAANACRSETTASLRGREGDRRVAPLSRPATRRGLPRSGARDT